MCPDRLRSPQAAWALNPSLSAGRYAPSLFWYFRPTPLHANLFCAHNNKRFNNYNILHSWQTHSIPGRAQYPLAFKLFPHFSAIIYFSVIWSLFFIMSVNSALMMSATTVYYWWLLMHVACNPTMILISCGASFQGSRVTTRVNLRIPLGNTRQHTMRICCTEHFCIDRKDHNTPSKVYGSIIFSIAMGWHMHQATVDGLVYVPYPSFVCVGSSCAQIVRSRIFQYCITR